MNDEERVNILLVDDHPENLLALEAILDLPEYRLIRAHSGEEALKSLLHEEVAVILLDVHMPGLDGFETAAIIKERERTKHIPIIFLTAVNKADRYIFKGYSVGAVDYLLKPFDPEILRSKVAVFVGLFLKNKEFEREAHLLLEDEQRRHERELLERDQASRLRYKNLAEAIPQIVWTAEPDGACRYYNRQWYLYTGLGVDESQGWGWKSVVHPDDLKRCIEAWNGALRNGRRYEVECRLKSAEGTYHWHLLRALPEKSLEGRIVGWLGTATDIDYQKRAEEALKDLIEELTERKKEAEEANLLKSEFVSNVSHELRTPLNVIIGYASLLLEMRLGKVNARQEEALSSLHRNAKDLLNLINNLLDLSKIEFGKMPVVIEPVDFKTLLPEIFQGVQPLMRGKEIDIQWRIAENLPVIQCDPLKVRQIFLNLITNAIKFTEKGIITVSAKGAADRRGIAVSVEDTGIGVPKEDLPFIFDGFKQIQAASTPLEKGTGLGLAIVKNAIDLLGGTIDVRSEFGKGSTFTVVFPDRGSDGVKAIPSRTEAKE